MVRIQREYVAGACNISREEERVRLTIGWVGTGLTLAAGTALVAFRVDALWRLTLFLPAALAAAGFLQAGMHFCANYGLRGVFNVKKEFGKTEAVELAEFVRKDRFKALQILGYTALIAAAVAGLAFCLP
jgi:hypothetical protein